MGYKNNDPCIAKALDEERLFVLMTRDNVAPEVVVEWIKLSIRTQPPEKLHEALDCAIEMIKKRDYILAKKFVQHMDNGESPLADY